ncbi:MAG: hypothetical protein EOM72_00550 [Opitutae bacterium]|nr:hypothetical protein [Opitutae bacterium]
MMAEMQALRIVAVGLAWAGLLGAGSARAGTETFDGTGLSNTWVEAGSFTGQQNVVWTFAHASGTPTVYTNNPSITLQTGSSTNKGWLLSGTITGGCSQVSAAFKQVLSATADCVVLVNGIQIANYKSSGVLGSTQVAAFAAFDASNRIPFTNEFTLMVSNRLASSGRMAIDDLTWEPFRLFARLPQTNAYPAYAGKEFEVAATVYDIGQAWTGEWSIAPAFAGGMWNADTTNLLLIPSAEDVGKTFTLSFAATDPDGTGYAHRASCPMTVLEGPRWVDFEGAAFGYDIGAGRVTNLNGMNWRFLNVATSDSTDRKIGATSARFKHTTALAASMESMDAFPGIGTVSLNFACYRSNRVVTFSLQIRGDGEEWAEVPNGTFNVEGHDDITNSVFSVDVGRSDDVWIRLISTGNAEQIANIDNVRVRPANELLPRLVFSGETNAPVGWETVLEFTLQNAEAVLREWTWSMVPSNAHAVFTADDHGPLRLRFSPVDANEWDDYEVTVSASIPGVGAVGATSVTVRVVSPPTFELVPRATNIAVPGIVDIKTTNVALHGGGTDWDNEWSLSPPFEKPPSKNQRNWYRIVGGTTEADVGPHTVTAVLTDRGTGVTTTNELVLVVTGGGGGGLTNEVYEIVSCSATNVVVNGRTGRVFRVVGTTNLMLSQWSWQGPPVTNADGADVWLDLPTANEERVFFYGVKVSEAP